MKPHDQVKIPLSTRVSKDIYDIVMSILPTININKREFTELALLGLIEKLDKNKFNLEGFDFITYAKVKKQRYLRQLQSIHRTEIKSKALFIQRVEQDLLEMLLVMTPLEEIKKLLLFRKLEAKHYDNPEKITSILNKLEQLAETNYKQTITYLRGKINDIEHIKKGKRETVKLLNEGKQNAK